MVKNLYKEAKQDNGVLNIYGTDEEVETSYKVPEWNDNEEELAFMYNDNEYFLSEFLNIHNKFYNPNPPEWMLEFDGIMSDSYFSGLLIKVIDGGEAVKVYRFTY